MKVCPALRLLVAEDIVVFHSEDLLDEHDLVRVQMPLSHFDFGYGTAGDVASAELEPGGQRILGHAGLLPQTAKVLADPCFNFLVHRITIFPIFLTLLYRYVII